MCARAKDALIERALDNGWLPHFVIRLGIQAELYQRAIAIARPTLQAAFDRKMAFIEELRRSPIAIHTDAANRQRYEVATGVMQAALGPRMKYSCCFFETGQETLAEAENKMLGTYVAKLGFEDGMSLLDLGCGWGDAVFFFAERFPRSMIVGFTNSRTQEEYILQRAQQFGFRNIEVIKGDVATDNIGDDEYDRIISVELFEHLKNYDRMMAKVSKALRPGGKFLLQMFCHRDAPYHVSEGWIATYFFTGGTMPSADLLLYFQQEDLTVRKQWWIPGRNYNRTIESWLANFIANKSRVWPHLVDMYGEDKAGVWFNRWQVHYLAWAELFISWDGEKYGVTHLLFKKKKRRQVSETTDQIVQVPETS
ncbi:hypothetical protein VTK56DRAFT_7378 [Thermocarpiscus australiensis]